MKAFDWSQDAVVLLETLHREGHSFSRIAAALSERFGASITRNAVIGKAQRIHLPGRPQPIRYPDHLINRKKRAPRPRFKAVEIVRLGAPEPMPPIVPADVPPPLLVRQINLEFQHCRWPIGDPRDADYAYCGHNRMLPHPYCRHHQQLAWTAPAFRKATGASHVRSA